MTDHSHHNLIGNKLDRRISLTSKNKSDWILLEFYYVTVPDIKGSFPSVVSALS